MPAVKVRVKGAVQGVGFRPFCYREASRIGLRGFVQNDLGGVLIHLEGQDEEIQRFLTVLSDKPPPAARITGIQTMDTQEEDFAEFRIIESARGDASQSLEVSADLATCDNCLRDILDPKDRRYGYAFTNCTDCGPRYTIISGLPYDRPKTSMREFRMCADCECEYEDPSDRRFHAQPNACKACGPELVLLDARSRVVRCPDPIAETARIILKAGIAAVKGLGGYHLMCDATNPQVIWKLRKRKRRPAKALALMCANVDRARKIAVISQEEGKILSSPAAPILLFQWSPDIPWEIREAIAPLAPGVGIMLAYTPLHHLLFAELDKLSGGSNGKPFTGALVATSANKGDEPIISDELELFSKLGDVFDAALVHNRRIQNRIDDSVGYINPGISDSSSKPSATPKLHEEKTKRELILVRRARGFAPQPFETSFGFPKALAVGAEMKGSFALSEGRHVWLSPHIGEMTNRETIEFFEDTLKTYLAWFRVNPEYVVRDMHPDYLSSRWAERFAEEQGIPLIDVQHHHAHIAAVILEHRIEKPVLGLALDGTGYALHESQPQQDAKPPDGEGEVWGCELLAVSESGASFKRLGHLASLALVGGEVAIRRPRRMAACVVADFFGQKKAVELFGEEGRIVAHQMDSGLGVIRASSAGRLFDAVAGLLSLVEEISFEAQAAVALESLCRRDFDSITGYRFEITEEYVLDPRPCFEEILSDLSRKVEPSVISTRFHAGLGTASIAWACRVREATGIEALALSGGVFVNRALMQILLKDAEKNGFELYYPKLIPASDGGVAAGQLQVAAALARLHRSNTQTT